MTFAETFIFWISMIALAAFTMISYKIWDYEKTIDSQFMFITLIAIFTVSCLSYIYIFF